jgi:hypothetical protein
MHMSAAAWLLVACSLAGACALGWAAIRSRSALPALLATLGFGAAVGGLAGARVTVAVLALAGEAIGAALLGLGAVSARLLADADADPDHEAAGDEPEA